MPLDPSTAIKTWFYDASTFDGEEYREGPFDTIEEAMEDAQTVLLDMREQEEEGT
jgi:hypothetical protein